MKRLLHLAALYLFTAAFTAGCISNLHHTDPIPDDPDDPVIDPADLTPFKVEVPVTDDWVWESRPSITLRIINFNEVVAPADIKIVISTDKKKNVCTETATDQIPLNSSKDVTLTTSIDLEPGFYRASCAVNGRTVRVFTFGISPTKIVSEPDKQADFDTYWDTAVAALEAVDMEATLTEIPTKSTEKQKVYLLEMNSLPDGDGEPVVIHGYYLEPQDGKKHPVIMHYYGYDDLKPGKLTCPSAGTDYAELFLSTRGQVINNRTAAQREPDGHGDFVNTYGDWFAWHFGQKDSYYYRGAFMDCVQGIRFMATRETSDMDNVFAEGSSQGGAFSYAAAALSPYPLRAIAPGVAFLGDFPDYFTIVDWPANTARASKGSMTDEQMFAFLSYFDTKNLATRIHCPVIANCCLQDGTCPPHTNMAPFNVLDNPDKEIYFYPTLGHEIPSNWISRYKKFFKARIVTN